MDIEIRPKRDDEFDGYWTMLAASFGEDPRLHDRDLERKILAGERTLVAVEGDTIVSGASAWPFQLTVPGGRTVPCAGVTAVGTLPTHRRRGLSRTLIRRQIEELHEEGTPLAYLWASEAVIYQRFGYGIGALSGAFKIRTHATDFVRPHEPQGRIGLLDKAAAMKILPDIYERVRPTRPGMIDRPALWLEHTFRDDAHERGGASPLYFAVYEDPEGPQGYVVYSIKENWGPHDGPQHELRIDELVAGTEDTYASLWRYCFDVDLVRTVVGWKRPVDELLLYMLLEPRALGFQIRDATWLRLVDVARSLEARGYSHEGRLVLEVRDEFAPWNDGTYELEGGPDGATCRPGGAAPDLSMRVEDLAAAYLGAVSFRQLSSAGRVTERNPGALISADAMFSSAVAPWCPWIF